MKVFIISGATATGKTNLGLELSQKYNGEIVNFDSLLFYKEINIGTAKPTINERNSIKHHMVDCCSIINPLNAFNFSQICLPIMNEIYSRSKNIFLVGGSGFYLQALLFGMYDSPTTSKETLQKSEQLYKEQGINPFIEILKEHDFESFKFYHPNDHYRIRRAVEHWWSHQTKFSETRLRKNIENDLSNKDNLRGWNLHHIYLNVPKLEHEKIIQQRTKTMLQNGLLQEVNHLLNSGFSKDLKPLQSIGYKESILFLQGEIKSAQELEEKINISTRQLAKSQRTWFNRVKNKHEFNPLTDKILINETIQKFLI